MLFAAGIGISSIPIFGNEFVSINDYYNHLARTAALLQYAKESAFSSYFLPNWQPLPDLAFDIWVFGLGRIVPITVAGKLFIIATFALILGGVIFLHRLTFMRWSLWPFLTLLLLYNRLFWVGYLNSLFGVALWLHAMSLWVYFHRARPWLRSSILAAAARRLYSNAVCRSDATTAGVYFQIRSLGGGNAAGLAVAGLCRERRHRRTCAAKPGTRRVIARIRVHRVLRTKSVLDPEHPAPPAILRGSPYSDRQAKRRQVN